MSECDLEKIDIFTKRILSKALLPCTQEVFQEAYNSLGQPIGEKLPLTLYIINNGSFPAAVPFPGSPVRCVKLYKRIMSPDFPQNTLICTQKSRVTLRFQLILVVEFEDGTATLLNLPQNLSNTLNFNPLTTRAFVEDTVINAAGIPVIQRQSEKQPYETLVILSTGVNEYTVFEYVITIPFSLFCNKIKPCYLDDPSLESIILLRCLNSDIEVFDPVQVPTTADGSLSVWTTEVSISVFEDITDKLGIDDDIILYGFPENKC